MTEVWALGFDGCVRLMVWQPKMAGVGLTLEHSYYSPWIWLNLERPSRIIGCIQ